MHYNGNKHYNGSKHIGDPSTIYCPIPINIVLAVKKYTE